jgi:hypothetical protein
MELLLVLVLLLPRGAWCACGVSAPGPVLAKAPAEVLSACPCMQIQAQMSILTVLLCCNVVQGARCNIEIRMAWFLGHACSFLAAQCYFSKIRFRNSRHYQAMLMKVFRHHSVHNAQQWQVLWHLKG